VGDGGWTFAHDQARKALEAEFGDKIQTSSWKACPKARTPSACCATWLQGNKLIFGTTFGYMDVIQKLAGDFRT
jgi:simple sugar transport system substrate-binding protein